MFKLVLVFFLISSYSFSQTLIGKTEDANIILEDSRYVVTFQSNEGKYVSFYMPQAKNNEDGLFALKNYVYLLFENKKGDYLLQFEDDSVLLVYESHKVRMELWRKHDSINKIISGNFTYAEFQGLFGEVDIRKIKI